MHPHHALLFRVEGEGEVWGALELVDLRVQLMGCVSPITGLQWELPGGQQSDNGVILNDIYSNNCIGLTPSLEKKTESEEELMMCVHIRVPDLNISQRYEAYAAKWCPNTKYQFSLFVSHYFLVFLATNIGFLYFKRSVSEIQVQWWKLGLNPIIHSKVMAKKPPKIGKNWQIWDFG